MDLLDADRYMKKMGQESRDETDEAADNATGRLDNVDWC